MLTEAVAHEPRGVIFAWDVMRTTYAVMPGAVTRESTEEIADNVLPGQLDKEVPGAREVLPVRELPRR